VDDAREAGVSLGGVFQVWATGLVPGVGGYATAGERLDARLAAGLVSIPAIKGVEFGLGFALASLPGSEAHDEILHDAGVGYHRRTNRAGGVEGGMTNGETLLVRAAMKPIPTQPSPLASVNIDTLEEAEAAKERSDVCAVPAAAVVAEAEVALVLADAYANKFGGDSIADLVAGLGAYRARIGP
jgi:chorismate synthase